MTKALKHRKKRFIIFILLVLLLLFWFSLPRTLFNSPTSTVLTDKNGILLAAKIADDKQWRFPQIQKVPYKFEKAIIQFEDKNFYYHPGFNPLSLGRALLQNIKKSKISSGGSTLTMQVIRLSRKGKPRTIVEKIIEIFLALRIELTYSKNEILALYSSNAPFGGNVVGLEAAAWRYYNREPEKLFWAEIATLAVLPNSPALVYPGKNQKKLLAKRNRLLTKLYKAKYIDYSILYSSMREPLPGKPFSIPQLAPHLLDRCVNEGYKGLLIKSSVDAFLQKRINEIIEQHQTNLTANDINNIAALVLEVNTGEVRAYIGNTLDKNPDKGNYVDIIMARRSTGSILKPYLYAAMLNDGLLVPTMLIPDIPTQINGFVPVNFSMTYDGAIPANKALARSLNVPAVKMLQTFGVERFSYFLKKAGITTINKPAQHYGLALILGGAEAKLWDLTGIYASMARTLNNYNKYNHNYFSNDFHQPIYTTSLTDNKNQKKEQASNPYLISAASIWLTFEAMVEVSRPDEEFFWQQFSSSSKIAWKTGTSFGNRDAWAIGCNPEYVVGVWVGNANGEGRPGLTGINSAAPILFDIFKLLKPVGWFTKPLNDMIKIKVCEKSGYKALPLCESSKEILAQKSAVKIGLCPYHQLVHFDKTEKWQVTSDCESISNMVNKSCFVLPPVMEYYFKNKNPFYKTLPPFRPDCINSQIQKKSMEFIYPKVTTKIYIPVEMSGKKGNTVFRVAHRNPATIIYWHLDDKYIGFTQNNHQKLLAPDPGKHSILIIDQNGETLLQKFQIINKKE
ncbi:MAG: penicillin-binding protein 1C [Bacteroidales bacterium]|nr:penicillin-binding protein 1C [Bacteroidales bacterium]